MLRASCRTQLPVDRSRPRGSCTHMYGHTGWSASVPTGQRARVRSRQGCRYAPPAPRYPEYPEVPDARTAHRSPAFNLPQRTASLAQRCCARACGADLCREPIQWRTPYAIDCVKRSPCGYEDSVAHSVTVWRADGIRRDRTAPSALGRCARDAPVCRAGLALGPFDCPVGAGFADVTIQGDAYVGRVVRTPHGATGVPRSVSSGLPAVLLPRPWCAWRRCPGCPRRSFVRLFVCLFVCWFAERLSRACVFRSRGCDGLLMHSPHGSGWVRSPQCVCARLSDRQGSSTCRSRRRSSRPTRSGSSWRRQRPPGMPPGMPPGHVAGHATRGVQHCVVHSIACSTCCGAAQSYSGAYDAHCI
jgi:hypothetical protein